MEHYAEILEQKLADACEIKDRDALHSYVLLLTEGIVERSEFEGAVQKTRRTVEELIFLMREESRQHQQRFEQIERQFEQIERKFEQVDKRFEQVDRRFEQMDKRFEDLVHYMDKRFEQFDKRFSSFQWLIGTGLMLIAVLMTVFEFIH